MLGWHADINKGIGEKKKTLFQRVALALAVNKQSEKAFLEKLFY